MKRTAENAEEGSLVAHQAQRCLVFLPRGYGAAGRDWPLIVFLHGAGERGDDLRLIRGQGLPKIVEGFRDFPFILVCPQCPVHGWWSAEEQVGGLKRFLERFLGSHRVDPDRIYLTGISMGGYGVWRLAAELPDRFAALAPVCGAGNPGAAGRLKHLPVWVFHGEKDDVVSIAESEQMVDALRAVGSEVLFTRYPDAGHDSWTETYSNPGLYEWLLRQKRRGAAAGGST